MKLPAHDVYTVVKSSQRLGAWISETQLDDHAAVTLSAAVDDIDDDTTHVLRLNLTAGTIDDVSADAARQWLVDLRADLEVNPDAPIYFPPMVERVCPSDCAEITDAWERLEDERHEAHKERQRDIAAYHAAVL